MRDPETGSYKPHWMSDSLVLFAPFSVLFFHDNFWPSLLFYAVPFYGYCMVIAYGLWFWKKVNAPLAMLKINGVGSFLLTVIGYYLFFHTGSLAEEPVVSERNWQASGLWVWWPFAVIVIAGAITALLNSESVIWVLGIVLLVVPFFSHHPLWAMLFASVVCVMVCLSLAKQQGSGAYVALVYFYMLAQMAALIVYAVVF